MAWTINNGQLYFNTLLRSGTGSSVTAITGVGFQPDLIWQKKRSGTSSHHITDSVRGATKLLYTEITAAEQTNANYVQSIDSDGFTMGSADWGTGDTVVAWNWKAGTSFTNDASATGIGSIDSTGSVNTTSGFSIVSFTGTGANATVAHGLGAVPKMIILKSRSNAYNWGVYHASIGATKYLRLNSTNAEATSSAYFQDTAPTSTLITLGSDLNINDSGNMIAYCFAEKQGYSKFGSYTGNGSTDGTFVYTGFKPAFVMLKSSSSGAVGWITHDNKRIGFNPNNYYVEPNNSNAESADTDKILLLSNGFKLTSTSASWNASGGSYIYMAFAENPFTSSTGTPVTAR